MAVTSTGPPEDLHKSLQQQTATQCAKTISRSTFNFQTVCEQLIKSQKINTPISVHRLARLRTAPKSLRGHSNNHHSYKQGHTGDTLANRSAALSHNPRIRSFKSTQLGRFRAVLHTLSS